MSILNAMRTGVSGLDAQGKQVGAISDNIANSQTVGYKRAFADLVTTTSATNSGLRFPAGVKAHTGNNISNQGANVSTGSAYDLAIAGNGFFVVAPTPNDPIQANYVLTRAGSFTPDENGFLQNSQGYYLHGFQYQDDGTLGVIDRTSMGSLEAVNVSDVDLQSEATSSMTISANFPSDDTGLATPGAPYVATAEYFTPLGEGENLEFSWQPTATDNQWILTVNDVDGAALGTVQVDFNDTGANAGSPATYSAVTNLAAAPSAFAFDTATGVATLTLDNGSTPQTLDVFLGAPNTMDGITQFAGDYIPQSVDKNGSSTGSLVRTEINDRGTLEGIFDNGARRDLYQIPLGVVKNPNGLKVGDANIFSITRAAGTFGLENPGSGGAGKVNSGALEQSTVDIATELTDLISAQRGYTTCAKIITTADTLLEVTTNIKR